MNISSRKRLLSACIIGLVLATIGLVSGLASAQGLLVGPAVLCSGYVAAIVLVRFNEYLISLGVASFVSVLWMFSVLKPLAITLEIGIGNESSALKIDLLSMTVIVPLALALLNDYRKSEHPST